jgi:hypothetical protein
VPADSPLAYILCARAAFELSRAFGRPIDCPRARLASRAAVRRSRLDQSTPYGSLPSRSPVPIPRTVRPRVIRYSVAAACAVTAGFRGPVSVTQVPKRVRLNRWRPARYPSAVHGSTTASTSGISRAEPLYFVVIAARGNRLFRWSGNQTSRHRRAWPSGSSSRGLPSGPTGCAKFVRRRRISLR